MHAENRDDDALARRLIEDLTAELDPGDAHELAAELARMIELGWLEIDEEDRVGIAPHAEPPRPQWPLPSRRPDRWCASSPSSSRGR